MKFNIRDATLQEFMENLVEHLNRKPKDEAEAQEIEHARQLLHDGFMRMAGVPAPETPEPLPPLPPGKARIASF